MMFPSHRIVAIAAAACTLVAAGSVAAQEVYVFDANHTIPLYEVSHMGFSVQRGSFTGVSGRVTLDRAAKKGAIDIVIPTNSIAPALPRMLAMMKSEDFFHVEKFPTMTYKSADLEFDGDNLVGAKGELTLLGVTQPVALKIGNLKCGPNPFNKRAMCGGEATTTIKRSEFGMKFGLPTAAGDEVKITIPFEAVRDQGGAG